MKKVLVVDDEHISATALSLCLEDEGFEVRTASSGREAIERAKEFIPDILITDWKLRDEIDGIDVAIELKRMRGSMHTILFSGLSVDDMGSRVKEIGPFKFLEKPCDVEEILNAVREFLAL